MRPTFSNQPHKRKALFWEHEGNRAVRKSRWKLVSKFPGDWELYDMHAGRTEFEDLSKAHPEIVQELTALYDAWAKKCNVTPWEEILRLRKRRRRN